MSRTHHASRDNRRTERAARAARLDMIERAWIASHGPRMVETYAAQQRIAQTFEIIDGKLVKR